MDSYIEKLSSAGLSVPEILLPAKHTDLAKWAVVACDQFTQNKSYWENLKYEIGDAPSTLNMILPEAYLEDGGIPERIAEIHQTMRRYLQRGTNNVLTLPYNAGIYVERITGNGTRRGLVVALDLECYDWKPDAKTIVRSSEGTIPERLPPRMEIRRGAPLELPHVILLFNDEEDILFTLTGKLLKGAQPIYNCGLIAGGGVVRGRLVCRKTDWNLIAGYFAHAERYAKTEFGGDNAFLFVVGDGNHSLAAAKSVWEEYKAAHGNKTETMRHPLRWALVEIENVHDESLIFEPIHRLLLNTPLDLLLSKLKELPGFHCTEIENAGKLAALVAGTVKDGNRYGIVQGRQALLIETGVTAIATVHLDPLIDAAVKEASNNGKPAQIDYVHESAALIETAAKRASEGAIGILLPPFQRGRLFSTIAENGPLPRKSFSMGEPCEKRYYIEARRLFD